MRTSLILITLLLVILPAAVLSLMASRALRHRELIFEHALETGAANAVQAVADRMNGYLEDDMERVVGAMIELLAGSGQLPELEAAACSARDSGALIGQIYLFMNPWGLVYPREKGESETEGPKDQPTSRHSIIESTLRPGSRLRSGKQNFVGQAGQANERIDHMAARGAVEHRELLIAALRREIASARSTSGAIRVTVDNSSYCFSMLKERKGLYVGYEVDPDKFAVQLAGELARGSVGGLALLAKGPGLTIPGSERPGAGEVIVSDSLNSSGEVRWSTETFSGEKERMLAEARLASPLDFVKIVACVRDIEEVRRAGELRSRLNAWGILVLAGGIVLGAWAVLWAASSEIRKARSRSDFVVGVSHDLRTPLSSMKMLADSLHLGHVQAPEKRKEFIGTIVRECERLNQLIDRVLFFVRFGQDALAYELRETDAARLVESAVQAFRARFGAARDSRGDRESSGDPGVLRQPVTEEDRQNPRKNAPNQNTLREHGAGPAQKGRKGMGEAALYSRIIPINSTSDNVDSTSHGPPPSMPRFERRVNSDVEPDLPKVRVDEGAITQVILNLLDNASKYGGKGGTAGVRGGVDVLARRVARRRWKLMPEREWVEICVRDYGAGIRRGQLRKVFRRFYRTPAARHGNVSGVGLGLALCRHVAKAHGGWMSARSVLGQGSAFSVFLPVVGGKGI